LVRELQYSVPENLVSLARQRARNPDNKWDVLDLGCGTGLIGVAIAPYARNLVGVDLSAKMLAKARDRNLYRRLEQQDLLSMMKHEPASSYDLIVAADVFVYLGNLEDIIRDAPGYCVQMGWWHFPLRPLRDWNPKTSAGICQRTTNFAKPVAMSILPITCAGWRREWIQDHRHLAHPDSSRKRQAGSGVAGDSGSLMPLQGQRRCSRTYAPAQYCTESPPIYVPVPDLEVMVSSSCPFLVEPEWDTQWPH